MLMVLIAVGVLGLLVGSFLNVVILRFRAGKKFTTGRSSCPNCKKTLSPLELLPVLSWVVLKGRCRHCKKPISWQYPAVELLTAVLFVLAYLKLDPTSLTEAALLALWLYVIGTFVVLGVYDIRWHLLPDRLMLPLMIPAALILLLEVSQTGSWAVATGPAMAALVFGGAFYMIALVSGGRWMGGGDIKLAFIMGLLLGLQKTVLAMLVAFNGAAVVGLALILTHRKKRTDYIAFGPFLIAGTLIAWLIGDAIIGWYLQVSGIDFLRSY